MRGKHHTTPAQAGEQRARARLRARVLLAASTALVFAAGPSQSQQLPTGGSVAAGGATITSPNSSTLNINQSTNQAIINWQSFSVGAGGTVNFNQPSSSSATLNRVLGSTPSTIAGTINAPGTVLLVNPNGIAITRSGVVNVGSFAASTLDIKNEDFLAGNYRFTGNGSSARVFNGGRINVSDGGFAALLGGQVANNGIITARLGKVGLGSGELITLDLAGDGFLSVAVPSNQLGNLRDGNGRALVSNRGKINADGGAVFLSAATATGILRDAVNVPGSIRANSVGTHNGRIVIGGGAGGKVKVSGRLEAKGGANARGGDVAISGASVNVSGKVDVSGKTGGAVAAQASQDLSVSGTVAAKGHDGKGGEINLTSANVTIIGAKLDASGATGGGVVLIGGDYQGGGTLAHALNVAVDANSIIRADATVGGDGGKVVVWSDGLTRVAGTLSARGANGGKGGLIETSGHNLNIGGIRAQAGPGGRWLLDPEDLAVDAAAYTAINAALNGGTDVELTTDATSASSNPSGIGTTIAGGNGDIILTDEGAISWSTTAMLTLNAYRNIVFNSNMTISGGGRLVMTTGAGGDYLLGTHNIAFTGGAGGLTINGNVYTLVYDAATMQGIGLSGNYALATSFAVGSWTPIGSSATPFAGTFAGLGHNVSNPVISTNTSDTGLFSFSSGTIRDIKVSGGSVSGAYNVGALVGTNQGIISNAGAIGVTVGSPDSYRIGGLVGWNDVSGNITQSHATGAVSGWQQIGGLVGLNSGVITQSYATGVVTGSAFSLSGDGARYAGGLAGGNEGIITQSYAAGSVSGISSLTEAGGLVGQNSGGIVQTSYATGNVTGTWYVGGLVGVSTTGSVSQSYATGAVTATDTTSGLGTAGGLVGFNSQSSVTDSYATGAVFGWNVGGLVGYDYIGTIDRTYATGRVTQNPAGSVGGGQGGLLGFSYLAGSTVANSYYDSDTTGQPGSTYGTALTTASFQSGGASTLGGAFRGGAGGLYPYLTTFFPSGVQAVSGVAYTDNGVTPAASGVNGAVTVGVIANGTVFGAATTGANGYYYVFGPAGSLSAGNSILAYTSANAATGATNAARLTTATASLNNGGVNIYGNIVTIITAETLLSAASADVLAAANGNAAALAAINGAGLRHYSATGASFTIDEAVTAALSVSTSASNADINVNSPVTLSGAAGLTLTATGSINFASVVTVAGSGAVVLNYGGDYAFGLTGSGFTGRIDFTGGSGSGATLSINGQSYTLLYSMADVQNINNAFSSRYALAVSLDAASTTGWVPLGTDGLGNVINSGVGFFGTLAGLGHTISNLTVNTATSDYAGLVGYSNGAVLRDLGLLGGSVTGASYIGGLVGQAINGTINSSYVTGAVTSVAGSGYVGGLIGAAIATVIDTSFATGAVSGWAATAYIGGLVGYNNGTISNSYATGAVSGISFVGGLAGYSVFGSVSSSYATGAVSGDRWVGGLIGFSFSSPVVSSYATGAVSGNSDVGGLIGFNNDTSVVTNSYWDTSTTGQGSSAGGTGLSTRQLQGLDPVSGPTFFSVVDNLGNGVSSAFSGGANGLYPYLTTFFPNGVQVIAGIAYTDAGVTPAASGASGTVTVTGLVNGAMFGSTTTGANGYYYIFAAPAAGNQVVVSSSGANGGATFQQNATFATSGADSRLSGLNIFGTYLKQQADAATTTLSGLSADFATALGGNSLPTYTNRRIDITSPSFDINQPINLMGGALVFSSGGATVTQSQAITATNLALLGSGATYTLDGSNNVGTLAADVGNGSVNFNNGANDLLIGSVAGTDGITATTLILSDTGTVTQSPAITVTNLALLGAGGSYTLTNASNNIGTLAADTGTLTLVNTTSLTIGTVGGTVGITTNGPITLTVVGSGDLTVADTVTSNGGIVDFIAGGIITIYGGGVEVDAGSGDIFLEANDMAIGGVVRTTGTVNLAPVTIGTPVTIGDAPVPAGLVIDSASNELNQFIGMSAFNVGRTRAGVTTAGAIQLGMAAINSGQVNLFSAAGVTQVHPVVLIGALGDGALYVEAEDTVDLRPGVATALVSGSSASGHFVAQGGGAALSVGPITTGGGEIVVVNGNGTLSVIGALISNGGNIFAASNGELTLGADVDAGSGSIGLLANGGGINQTAGRLIGANLLAIVCNCGPFNMTLDSATNSISGNVSLSNLSGGNISFTNLSGYTVGGIDAITYASLGPGPSGQFDTASNGTGPGIRTSGPGASVTLTAGGDVDQAVGSDDLIVADNLVIARLGSADPDVIFDNDNEVSNLGTVNLGLGAFLLYNNIDLTITGAGAAGGGYTVITEGFLTQNAGANIDTSRATSGRAFDGAIGLAGVGGGCGCGGGSPTDLILNANLNAGTGGIVRLGATGSITQFGGAITADSVTAEAISGSVSLTSVTNSFAAIDGASEGGFSATTSRSLTVGLTGSGSVFSYTGFVILTALGGTSDILVDGEVSAAATATLLAGRDLTLASSNAVITSLGGGDAIVLSAVRNFVNNAGTAPLDLGGGGRWLVYANNPTDSTLGGLDSGNAPIWNATYVSRPPASVTETGNRFLFAMLDPNPDPGTGPNNPVTPPSQVTPSSNGQPANTTTITFQNNALPGLTPVSFTPPANNIVTRSGGPQGMQTGNNGFDFKPISQFDPAQYSDFKLPDYAGKAGQAAVFTMIARAVQPDAAASFMIDGFWTGNDGAWTKGSDGKPVANRVTFSDGAGKTVAPTESNGFPIVAGTTDFGLMLTQGPVMIGGTNGQWMLAIGVSADGKSIVANDPSTGGQVLLSFDAATKTVGGVTATFNAQSNSFVPVSNAGGGVSGAQGFVPATFFAVTVQK